MLKILRKNTKFILWLLISSFVLWGVGTAVFSRGGGPTYAGIMFGKKISLDEFGKAWTESRIQAMLMYGEDFFNMAQSLDLDRETWNRLILLREARNRRIKTSDQEVIQVISGMPMFIRGDKFDQATYDRIVKEYFRVMPREFENTIRNTLLITKLQQSILTEVTLTPEEVKEEYGKANEKAKANYILFAPADYHDRVSVSENDIENYYTGHKEDFKKPLQVDVTYLFIPAEKQELADEVSAWIGENPSLQKASQQFDLPLESTGLFSQEDQVPGVGWSSEFSVAAFSLKENQISEIVKTTKGFYLLSLKDKKQPYVQPLDEVRPDVQEALTNQLAAKMAESDAQSALSKIKEMTQSGNTFENAAMKLGKQTVQTDLFTRTGYIKGIGEAPGFGDAAFALKVGEVSDVVEVPNGFAILKLDEYVPVSEGAFEKDKEEFQKELLKQKRLRVYANWYINLATRAALVSNIEKMRSR